MGQSSAATPDTLTTSRPRPPARGSLASHAGWNQLGPKKYRLTLLFVAISLTVITAATVAVNRIVGDLAERHLIRIAEENTARDGLHIQSMLRGNHSTHGMSAGAAATDRNAIGDMPMAANTTNGEDMTGMHRRAALDLDSVAQSLPETFPALVEGLNVVKFNLFDLDGNAVWSTDPATIGISKRESPLYAKAVAGEISSTMVKDHELLDPSGASRRLDVVETYLPLRDTPSGEIIGALEIYRDVGGDVAIQVDDAKSTVLWTTMATMGGLFLVLLGFIVVADVTIHRSNSREISLVQNQLVERE